MGDLSTVSGKLFDRFGLLNHGLESVLDPPNRHAFD